VFLPFSFCDKTDFVENRVERHSRTESALKSQCFHRSGKSPIGEALLFNAEKEPQKLRASKQLLCTLEAENYGILGKFS
jgi:hypothetical protein